jgi:hypothetical protein
MNFQLLSSLPRLGGGWCANQSRGCVKTVLSKFGNDQFLNMGSDVEMSRRIQWSEIEFLNSLSPEPTPIGAISPHSRLTHLAAWLFFGR